MVEGAGSIQLERPWYRHRQVAHRRVPHIAAYLSFEGKGVVRPLPCHAARQSCHTHQVGFPYISVDGGIEAAGVLCIEGCEVHLKMGVEILEGQVAQSHIHIRGTEIE